MNAEVKVQIPKVRACKGLTKAFRTGGHLVSGTRKRKERERETNCRRVLESILCELAKW